MKKKIIVAICFVFMFSFVNAQELYDEEILNILQENSEVVAQESPEVSDDVQSETQEILNDEETNAYLLDVLEENTEIVIQENEKIIEANEKEKEREKNAKELKKENIKKNLIGWNSLFSTLGMNYPVTSIKDNSSPMLAQSVGFSVSILGNYSFLTAKGGFCIDNIEYPENSSSKEKKTTTVMSLSLGVSPIHGQKYFLGLYGTLTFDEIGNYSYTGVGASATFVYNFSFLFGLFMDFDATYRFKAKGPELTNSLPTYLGSWRFNPSIGVVFKPFA